MTIDDKIRKAKQYVAWCLVVDAPSSQNTHDYEDHANDAANAFASNYEEYMTIWDSFPR